MSVFEEVTDVGLEILTDTELDRMIKELEYEKERRKSLDKINAVNEIIEVLHENAKPLIFEWFTCTNGNDFTLDELIGAFENYLERLQKGV